MANRVLIIDDEWTIQRALQARLGAQGFEVELAGSGPAGIDAARRARPDAILLDIRMPGMDGFEVFRRLRADADLAAIPVIFLTANVQDSARQEALSAGAAGFLSKPYDAREVVETIHRACSAPSAAPRAQQHAATNQPDPRPTTNRSDAA